MSVCVSQQMSRCGVLLAASVFTHALRGTLLAASVFTHALRGTLLATSVFTHVLRDTLLAASVFTHALRGTFCIPCTPRCPPLVHCDNVCLHTVIPGKWARVALAID